MHDVSNAINVLDPNKGIDKAICKQGSWVNKSSAAQGKCAGGTSGGSVSTTAALSQLFDAGSSYGEDMSVVGNEKMEPHTSGKISADMRDLDRDQKGKISSAFAKAHEGAEIVNFLESY